MTSDLGRNPEALVNGRCFRLECNLIQASQSLKSLTGCGNKEVLLWLQMHTLRPSIVVIADSGKA